MNLVAVALIVFFVLAALVHLYWAFGGRLGHAQAIPSAAGVARFKPSRRGTIAVAVALLAMALSVTWKTGIPVTLPNARLASYPLYVLATAFILRAIGEFRYVGFFKRVYQSSFARWDTFVFSPLCLLIAYALWGLARS